MNTSPDHDFALGTLEEHRRRLLDLSARNGLLNFAHEHRVNVPICNERPNRLHNMLLSEEELGFQAIPDPTRDQLLEAGHLRFDPQTGRDNPIKKAPTAMEWARVLGYAANYRPPESGITGDQQERPTGKTLQTLLFPAELERRLRELQRRAQSAVEKTGSNICYVALGFLEWLDTKDNDNARSAPLLLLPVRIARGRLDRFGGSYRYSIAYTGEELIPNLALREKLRIDFGLALPGLDHSLAPEDYFSELERLIAGPQPRWQVRRDAAVALFNFSKLLTYLDLDPARWQGGNRITRHPIAGRFLMTRNVKRDSGEFTEEHAIDDLPDVHQRYPLVIDADSTQHGALVDVLDGRNLVIEGPPGTGKSQTISNLIAAALAQGRRVLFVAGKLAALEVVKQRLDRAGLGDFCLELHSHKSGKRRVLDELVSRLSKQDNYRRPQSIKAEIEHYDELKNGLRGYAQLINSEWKETGETIHEILMAACRHREVLDVDPALLHPQGYDGRLSIAEARPQGLDSIHLFAADYRRLSNQLGPGERLSSHPWYGIGNPDLQPFDQERVCAALSRWQEALEELAGTLESIASRLGSENGGVESGEALNKLDAIERVRSDLQNLPPLHGDEALSALPLLQGDNLAVLTRHLQIVQQIRRHHGALPGPLRPELAADPESHGRLSRVYGELKELGVEGGADLPILARHLERIKRLQKILDALIEPVTRTALYFGGGHTDLMEMNEAGLKEFRGLVGLTCRIRLELLTLRDARFDHDGMERILLELIVELQKLDALRERLAPHFALDRLPCAKDIAEMRTHLENSDLLGWRSEERRSARDALLQLSTRPDAGLKELAGHLKRLYQYAKGKQVLEENTRYRKALGNHFAGLETPVADLLELRRWYDAVRRRYGLGIGPKVALGDALIGMSPKAARWLHALDERGIVGWIDHLLRELGKLKSAFGRYQPLQSRHTLLTTVEGPLAQLQQRLEHNLEQCRQLLSDPQQVSIAQIGSTVHHWHELQSLRREWKQSALDPHWLDNRLDPQVEPERFGGETLLMLEHTEALARFIAEKITTAPLRAALLRDPVGGLFAEIEQQLTSAWQAQLEQRRQFADLTLLDVEAWQQGGDGTLDGLMARNRAALERAQWLPDWIDYVRVRRQSDAAGFSPLTRAVEQGRIRVDDIDAGLRLGVCDFLTQQIFTVFPDLAHFSEDAQLELQKQFRQCDQRLQQLQRERMIWNIAQNQPPPGNRGERADDYTELALLRHQSAQQGHPMPLQQLLVRAGNAVAALKPCFMMSPAAVAQYLTPGEMEFDLVILDEASQMRPEEALGAIARGRQLVVIGDPMQLPPTSLFAKGIDEEEEQNATGIAVTESILDSAKLRFHSRPLRWHYRSRHESLVAFSNHAFYKGQMVLFPSPLSATPKLGTKLTRVPEGRLADRRNEEEARTVALEAQRHLLRHPRESLGIAAMSEEQREQIERAFEALRENDPQLREALEENLTGDEPLFIKNLENVQGDERDVIFISCTYAPEEAGGKVRQGFGPLNSDAGWRQLNVLITRARKRMVVFSSIGPEQIEISGRSRRSVSVLKEFLSFAESGRLHPTLSPPRSLTPPQTLSPDQAAETDFEATVASALAQAGYQCVPRVGTAGCFIDLAVRDPENPGRYLLGIECDGPSYLSAQSVRDRDHLQLAVLKRQGWRIHRIWSVDWYKNPKAQIEGIIRELDALKGKPPGQQPEAADMSGLAANVVRKEE